MRTVRNGCKTLTGQQAHLSKKAGDSWAELDSGKANAEDARARNCCERVSAKATTQGRPLSRASEGRRIHEELQI